jgi:hypothetical protein
MAERKTRRKGTIRALGRRLEVAGGEVMKAWRTQAERPDRVGDLSYQGLELAHVGAKLAARSLSRLEEATQPPRRTARREPNEPAHPARHAPPAAPPARHRPAPRPQEPEARAS